MFKPPFENLHANCNIWLCKNSVGASKWDRPIKLVRMLLTSTPTALHAWYLGAVLFVGWSLWRLQWCDVMWCSLSEREQAVIMRAHHVLVSLALFICVFHLSNCAPSKKSALVIFYSHIWSQRMLEPEVKIQQQLQNRKKTLQVYGPTRC